MKSELGVIEINMYFVGRGLICKRLRDYEPKYSECLCSELTFTNKKWICFSIYRPPESSNLILKYENLLIIGDFDIDMKSESLGYDKLDEFCDLFNLTNLIKLETCFTKNHKSPLIDLFLTNTLLFFQKTHVSETGLINGLISNKLITTFFKTNFSRQRPKVLSYRNYKNFIESKCLNDLNETIISFDNENPNQKYNVLSNRFLEVVNVHAPLKAKIIRGNDAPFVVNNSEKLFIPEPGLKIKYSKILGKKTKWHIKRKDISVYL